MPHEHRRASIDSKAFSLYHDDHDDDDVTIDHDICLISSFRHKKCRSQFKNLSRKSRDVSAENKIGAKS